MTPGLTWNAIGFLNKFIIALALSKCAHIASEIRPGDCWPPCHLLSEAGCSLTPAPGLRAGGPPLWDCTGDGSSGPCETPARPPPPGDPLGSQEDGRDWSCGREA